MRIRIDINEMSAMADTLQAGAIALAEVGADVCGCDLPSGVAAIFDQHRASMKKTFDDLATEYRLHALNLLLRALIATKDVDKAVAIHPPAPAPTAVVSAPTVTSSGTGRSNYDPGKYYSPGSAAWNRLSAAEKRMNDAAGRAIVMPMVMANYSKSMDRYNASMMSMFEMSSSDLEAKLGRLPTMADREYYTPNTYKSRFG